MAKFLIKFHMIKSMQKQRLDEGVNTFRNTINEMKESRIFDARGKFILSQCEHSRTSILVFEFY